MGDTLSELDEHNLEEFLHHDSAFVDYFNTFLSLPCFPERIFYNKENDLLEQFTQRLVKDEDDNVQLKYDLSTNNVQISYCVTVLEREKALDWLKKYRLSEFIKSGLYAEYNLSKTLSSAQAMYIDTIRNDLSRASKLTNENSTSQNEAGFLSGNNSIFTASDQFEAGQIDEIINDYSESMGERELVHEQELENPAISPENFQCFPSVIVNEIETDCGSRDEEMSVSVTSDSNEALFISDFSHVSETNDYVTMVNDSSSDIEGNSVTDDVMNDVIIDDIIINDVTGPDGTGDDVGGDIMDNGIRNGDVVTDSDAIDTDIKSDDIIGDDVISDDVSDDVRGGDYGTDVTTNNKSTDDGSSIDINSESSIKFMKSNTTEDEIENEKLLGDDLLLIETELNEMEDNSDGQYHNISTPSSDVITKDKPLEKDHGKEETKFCKCFHKSSKTRDNELHNKNMDNNLGLKEQSNLFRKTDNDAKERYETTDTTNASIEDSSEDTKVVEDDLDKRLENSKIPATSLNTVKHRSLAEENVQNQLNDSNTDSLGFLENKSYTISNIQETSLQSDIRINDGTIKNMNTTIDITNENIDHDTMAKQTKNTARGNNLESSSSNMEDQTSLHSSSDGICDKNKIQQKITNSDSSNIFLSDINLPKEPTSYDADGNVGEKNIVQKSTDAATVDSLQLLHDVRNLEVDDPALNFPENKSEHHSLDESSIKRSSSVNSILSSDISERERKSSIAEEILDNSVNLSSKEGMDKFKEFLINTKGETLFLFWIHVETWKHLGDSGDKIRLLQEMKEQFLRNGSPLELPNEIKKQAGRCFTADLSQTQKIIAEPLRCYWCPRFTLHQIKTQLTDKNQYEAKVGQKTWSSGFQPKSDVLMYPSTSPHLVRAHTSTPHESLHACSPRETLNERSPRETLKEGKFHVRSKSAHGRLVSTPCHTNAGKKQLEIYATPQPTEFGFEKRPISVFPPCNDEEYLSSVRLIINPRCKPKSRAAWPQRPENERTINDIQRDTSDSSGQNLLLDSLMYRNESGCYFKKFVSKQNNQLWSNCLSFSQAVMDYTAFFDGETLNPVTVLKKAQWIYARFIRSGSICDIKLDWKTQEDIRQKLNPPYEELFDCVEDHVFACLKEPWDSLCGNEQREYEMIPKTETVRYLEVQLKRTRGRSKNSFLQEELESEDGREHSERGKYSIEDANHPQSLSSDGVSFESVIKDRDELEGFQKYLEKKDPKGVMDLMAWTDMETFQRIPRTIEDKRNKKAKEIRQAYLNSRYFFGPDSPATKEAQNLILSINGSSRIKERPSSSVISECQKYVRCRIERRWLALYKASQEYKERLNPKQNVSDVVEDIMLRRRLQRSEAAWRVLNSRWVSSSRDIVALRQTLNNPESCLAFRKFVALKGDTYENDVLFWIEIQKYKDLCHRHASEECIKKKVQAITECFITSSIPPELQVDVPIEMAEKLMERITSRNQNIGPYLFREVQMTVFRVLFNMWKDFCSFRSSIHDGNLLEVLEKKLSRHRAEAKAKKEASERKKIAKQEAERKKKEKEEKEKKELKSMEQLMSLMTETSSTWEQEENDVIFWKYSKHISASVEPTLSVGKKVSTQDNTSFIELTNQRSIATKSTNQITNSLRSERHAGKVPKSKRFDSLVADSTYSTHSKHSIKGTNSTASRIPKISQPGRSSRARDIKRYDIIDKNSSGKMTSSGGKNKNSKNKLLKNRERKKSKKILDHECFDSVSNVGKELSEKEDKQDRVKSPRERDSRLKSRRNDSPPMENAKITGSDMVTERPGSLRTSLLRRQWNQSHDKNRSPVPLTSQLLKDFTNSPEGAPLDTPLSLARINLSDDVSVTKSSVVHRKTPPTSAKISVQERTRLMSWRSKRANIGRKDIEQYVPDVTVN